VFHSILCILRGHVLDIRKALAEQCPFVTAILDFFDFTKRRKNFLQMFLENVSGEPADVDFGWLRGGCSLTSSPTSFGPRPGAGHRPPLLGSGVRSGG